MGNNNQRLNLMPIATKILFQEHEEELEQNFFNIIKHMDISEVPTESVVWALNALNFLQVNNATDRVKFVLIEECKLRILSGFMEQYNYMKDVLMGENLQVEEVLEENEAGAKIYKQYIPTPNSPFLLPPQGQSLSLRVESFDKDNNTWSCLVLIDDCGRVKKVIEPLTQIEEAKVPTEFDDIYTDLLTDILNEK